MFCGNESHKDKHKICNDCASKGKHLQFVFYCERCNKDASKSHESHSSNVKSIYAEQFMDFLKSLKSFLLQIVHPMIQKTEDQQKKKELKQHIKKLMNENFFYLKIIQKNSENKDLIKDTNFMSGIIQIKKIIRESQSSQLDNKVKQILQNKILLACSDIKNFNYSNQRNDSIKKFQVQLPQSSLILSKKNKFIEQIFPQRREEAILNFVFQAFTCNPSNKNQCENINRKLLEIIKTYEDSLVLYLCRIYLESLTENGNQQIPKILKEIKHKVDPNYDQTDVFHYYQAMAQWIMIEKPQKGDGPICYELKNKKYYKIQNHNFYIKSMKKAIEIKQRPIYFISLGLGYIMNKNYKQALQLFNEANSLIRKRNDSLDLNLFWTQIQMNVQNGNIQSITENLQKRPLYFIINICKYFKKSKHYEHYVKCSQHLLVREPSNINFQIQYIKSIILYCSRLDQISLEEKRSIKKVQNIILQIKTKNSKYAPLLQKRLQRMKAKIKFKNQKIQQAIQGYEKLTIQKKSATPSDYYNFALSTFQLFLNNGSKDEDQLQGSYQNIMKALQLKPKNPKYKKAKFFICCYMRKLKQSYECFKELQMLNPNDIKQSEYKKLIEYIQNNKN